MPQASRAFPDRRSRGDDNPMPIRVRRRLIRLADSYAGAHLSRSARPWPASQGRAPVFLGRLPGSPRGDRVRVGTRRQRLPAQQQQAIRRTVRHYGPRLHRRLRIRRGAGSGKYLERGSRPGRRVAPRAVPRAADSRHVRSRRGSARLAIWLTVNYPAVAASIPALACSRSERKAS
jgi:hypothetical protein